MALFNYQKQVLRLLRDQKTLIVNPTDLITYINTARGQVAGAGECIRTIGTISSVSGQRNYNFSGINTGVSATTGIQGAIHVRRISYNSGSGQLWLTPRPWEWFELYHLNSTTVTNGNPQDWAQYGQGAAGTNTGSAASGSFYIDPPPNNGIVFNCDCVCYPIALVDDTTVEALPYLWTDAVPFYAAYYALLSEGGSQQQDAADRMFKIYQNFIAMARQASNPSVLRWQYEQASKDTAQKQVVG